MNFDQYLLDDSETSKTDDDELLLEPRHLISHLLLVSKLFPLPLQPVIF